ncbi:ATP-dependent DNA helicase RecG [Clostridium sp. OM07-9AC]|nr:ATP-dependent DNA helicase RecG [Clostridium sp. OM07-9AC]
MVDSRYILTLYPLNNKVKEKVCVKNMQLSDSIREIKGIGEKSEKLFAKLGISTVEELLFFYPREYEIVENIRPINEVKEGHIVVVSGTLGSKPRLQYVRNLKIVSTFLRDASGQLEVTWFNMPFIMKTLRMGTRYIMRGRVINKNGRYRLQQPKLLSEEEYHKLLKKLQPVYPLTAGLTNHAVSKAVGSALKEVDLTGDYLPLEMRKKYNLILRKQAVHAIHFPKDKEEYMQARRRLVFEEFFFFALALHQMKQGKHQKPSPYEMNTFELPEKLMDRLPFDLTDGQKRAWEDIRQDLTSGVVMNRLIQGDVGSGKTIVAVLALLACVENGHQGAIMVPTEVLAEQHLKTFQEYLEPFDIRVDLLVGSMTASQKHRVYEALEMGMTDIVIGTHALIQEKVHYKDLALVVTDEQHRFGVRQREEFSQKGLEPHMLVMSATPIPRTLAIILYGDLDISVIDVMPSDRLPIKNCVVGTSYRPKAYEFIEAQVRQGHQVYIICPMVEESENMEAENVTDYTDTMKGTLSPSIRVECLHGKMKAGAKNDIMERFAAGEIDVLVSTTVIEVGINVPNATVMMVENAERFGLAQLHQLRGRVGRGSAQSYCIFMAGNSSRETMERLNILGGSNDGFYVAEQDLKLRGPGDLFGIRQSGELNFALADIYQDAGILKDANEAAAMYTKDDILKLCKKYEGLRKRIMAYTDDIFL